MRMAGSSMSCPAITAGRRRYTPTLPRPASVRTRRASSSAAAADTWAPHSPSSRWFRPTLGGWCASALLPPASLRRSATTVSARPGSPRTLRGGDRDLSCLRLVVGARHAAVLARLGAIAFGGHAIVVLAVAVRAPIVWLTALLLVLLRGLVHRIEDAEIVLGVLEIALRHHAVARSGRVPAELQVFLEQLLRGAAHARVWTAAVEGVVAVERDVAAVMAYPAASTAAAMLASAHIFHIHASIVAPSCWRSRCCRAPTCSRSRLKPGNVAPLTSSHVRAPARPSAADRNESGANATNRGMRTAPLRSKLVLRAGS